MAEVAQKKEKIAAASKPPVVVILGHIDHGKTTLLDAIRKSRVAEKEAGGITQSIGAYQVEVRGRKITFIDTPGHEDFSKMRARGARLADIAVIVVAADEGVKPQTEEAIRIAQEAKLPLVVALNKIDKSEADPERAKRELAEKGVLLEGYGGSIPSAAISAKTGQGLDDFLETILLVADLEGVKADFSHPAAGTVIESHLDPRRGATATLLLADGTLRRGEVVVIGRELASVRIFENFFGKSIDAAEAGDPVRLAGLKHPPALGERFQSFSSRIAAEAGLISKVGLEEIAVMAGAPAAGASKAAEEKVVFNVVLKGDVLGSVEALETTLEHLQTPRTALRVLKREVGEINESDIKLAAAGKTSLVIGFRVTPSPTVAALAERERVRVVSGEVIYELTDEVKRVMREIFPVKAERKDIGRAEVLALFRKERGTEIVGGRVAEGLITLGARFEIERNAVVIGQGAILELQSNRAPAVEVNAGAEFGAKVSAELALAKGDFLRVFRQEKVMPEF